MVATVQEIAFAFHYSSKKMDKLEQELCGNNAMKDKLDGKSKHKLFFMKLCGLVVQWPRVFKKRW
jgi:hypothetical protein